MTFVTLERSGGAGGAAERRSRERGAANTHHAIRTTQYVPPRRLHHPQRAGQRAAGDGAGAAAVAGLDLPADRLERLKTAVGEATMNAMEHGNRYDPDLPVAIRVQTTADELIVSITDHGGGQAIPEGDAPDLEAKLAGLQSPRGWGLFLIRSMVDEIRVTDDGVHHTVDLIMNLGAKGDRDASQAV